MTSNGQSMDCFEFNSINSNDSFSLDTFATHLLLLQMVRFMQLLPREHIDTSSGYAKAANLHNYSMRFIYNDVQSHNGHQVIYIRPLSNQ